MAAIDPRARAVVKSLEAYQPGRPIEKVRQEFRLTSVIKLASNENALGASPKALAALRKAAGTVNRYPDSACAELKARLTKRFRLDPSWFIVGNGSDELLVLALRAFVDPGDEVVVAEPTFLIYALQAKACGATVVKVPMPALRYDMGKMLEAITPHTKLVFLANPDNPMGTYVRKREFEAFLREIPRHVIVVVDEAYYEFVEAKDYPQTVRYLDDASLILTRSFSKAYGLAGLRIGYAIAKPSLIAAMEAVREPFNVNSLAQAAACAALEDHAFLQRTRRMTGAGRRYLTAELSRLGLEVMPTVTNFVLVRIGPKAAQVAGELLAHGVIVRELSAWKLDWFLRVTIGTMPENRRFLQVLKKTLAR